MGVTNEILQAGDGNTFPKQVRSRTSASLWRDLHLYL